MVRVYGAVFGDVTDRSARLLGQVYGINCTTGTNKVLPIAGNDGVIVSSKPWWSRDLYGELCELDDFSGTMKWEQRVGAVTQAADAKFVLQGVNAMKMVTGAVAGNQASGGRYFTPSIPRANVDQIEFWFCLNAVADATPRDFEMIWSLEGWPSPVSRTFGIRYWNYEATVLKRKWQYWDSTGAWVDIPGATFQRPRIVDPQFLYVMLQITCPSNLVRNYSFLQIGAMGFNMTGIAPQTGAYTLDEQEVEFVVTTDIAAATTAYVGGVILHNGVTSVV